jgi:hypothetical protein
MNFLGISSIVEGVGSIIDSVHTSDKEKLDGAIALKKLDNELLLGQVNTNIEEAKHKSIFVAGWRPAAGWVCAIALGLGYIPKFLVLTTVWTYQCFLIMNTWNGTGAAPVLPLFPDLGLTDLIGLLGALLGLAGMRSFERKSGVATESLKQ